MKPDEPQTEQEICNISTSSENETFLKTNYLKLNETTILANGLSCVNFRKETFKKKKIIPLTEYERRIDINFEWTDYQEQTTVYWISRFFISSMSKNVTHSVNFERIRF